MCGQGFGSHVVSYGTEGVARTPQEEVCLAYICNMHAEHMAGVQGPENSKM